MHENERNYVLQDNVLSTLYSMSDVRKIRAVGKIKNTIYPTEGINNIVKLGKFDTILKWRKLCLKMWLYVAISENMRFSCFLPNSSVFIPSYLFLRDVSKWFSEKRVIAFLSLFLIEVFFNLWDRRIPSSLIKIRNIQWKRNDNKWLYKCQCLFTTQKKNSCQ